MKLKDLVDAYSFDYVWDILIDLYPDQIENMEGYAKVYKSLNELAPEPSELTIIVEYVIDDGTRYVDVSGYKDDYDTRWAIEFRPWSEWLGMDVVTQFDDLDTLAHCLFDMTFCGYDQREIKTYWDEVMECYEDAMSTGDK